MLENMTLHDTIDISIVVEKCHYNHATIHRTQCNTCANPTNVCFHMVRAPKGHNIPL